MKKKKAIIIVIVAIIAVSAAYGMIHKYFSPQGPLIITDISAYEATLVETSNRPALPEAQRLGNYSDIDFRYTERITFLLSQRSYALTAYYSPEDYATQTAYLNENCTFVEGASWMTDDCDPTFEHNGFVFRTEEDGLDYPKKMNFIGFNDQEHAICLIAFQDIDLDECRNIVSLLSDFDLFGAA